MLAAAPVVGAFLAAGQVAALDVGATWAALAAGAAELAAEAAPPIPAAAQIAGADRAAGLAPHDWLAWQAPLWQPSPR